MHEWCQVLFCPVIRYPKDAKAVVLQSLARKLQAKKRMHQVGHDRRIYASSCLGLDSSLYLCQDEVLQLFSDLVFFCLASGLC